MSNELLTLANALPQTIESQDDYELLAEALTETVLEQKTLGANPEIAALKARLKNHGDAVEPWKALEKTLRARIIEAKTAYEAAVEEAIRKGVSVPTEMVDPPGMSWRQVKKWRVTSFHSLAAPFIMEVVNEEVVEKALEQGATIPGIEVYDEFILTVRTK